MKLRFKVDQGEALRRGVDAPTSIVTIEIDPKQLSTEERNLLADRMDGIDLREMYRAEGDEIRRGQLPIKAAMATFDSLMAAVRANEAAIRPAPQAQRKITRVNRKS